jgi:DNA-3-methyladenine glycosylase
MAMSIDKALNRADLLGKTLWLEDRGLFSGAIQVSPRVGVDYAGEYKDKPWRFFEDGNPHVSRVRFRRG